jgi:serine/threonine protein kinase
LKYLEAENNFYHAVEQDKDMETIEALQMELDRLEALKPKSSNLILSVEKVMSKIELFIQTYNVPRAKALATNRDMNGLRAFKEVIAELKKHLEELSPKSDSFDGDNIIEKIDISSKDVMSSSDSKIVKLTQRVSEGTKSCNKSIIVDAEFKGLQVKVKLKKDRNALRREYRIMETLNMKAPYYFIRPFDLVSYNKGELVPCDGCFDDLSGLHGIIMESGKIDMKAYSQMNCREPIFQIDFKSVGFEICEIIKSAHSMNIALMDLKPANIVRVINNYGTINHKAIDFDEAIDLNNFSFSTAISSTPRYIAPEVAKAMLHPTENNKFKPTLAVDVFSFGLWVFEVFNDQVSFWTCLGVDESKDEDVLISASNLTDDQIERVIRAKLGDMKSTAARTWLLDALKVNPYDRLTIERLNVRHSLFTNNYATISMNNLATKASVDQAADKIMEVSNENARQIMENNNTHSNEQFSALLHRLSNVETDVSGISRKLQSISSVLEALVGNKQDCPRLIIVLPKDGNRYVQMLKNPVDAALFKSPMIVKFVCPITHKCIDDYEVEVKDAREFVKKYGPILLISIRILQVGMTVGKLLGLPLPSADLFLVSELKSIMALNNSNNVHDKLMTLALNKMSDVINQPIDQSLGTFSTQLDACLNPAENGVNNMQINKSLQTITDANYKEFHKLLTKNYTMDLANELRGKMSRLCGEDGSIEWVSVAGKDEWCNKHGRLNDTNVKLNNSISEKELYVNQEVEKIHDDRRGKRPSTTDQGVQQTNANAAQCCTVS